MLILASSSPRRQELLRQIGCEFKVVVGNVTEDNTLRLQPAELAVHNALLKGRAVAGMYRDLPVVAADTIVVALDGRIFGKPGDPAEAKRMLRALAGCEHRVLTGLAFFYGGCEWTGAAETIVQMDELDDGAIDAYVATGEPLDKAGAYGIQGRASLFIKSINGCYNNVVGLPLNLLYKLAQKAGVSL